MVNLSDHGVLTRPPARLPILPASHDDLHLCECDLGECRTDLLPLLEQARHQAITLEPEHWGSAAFGLALASMAHERQYSRLFRS